MSHHTHPDPAVRDLIDQAEARGAERVAQAVERLADEVAADFKAYRTDTPFHLRLRALLAEHTAPEGCVPCGVCGGSQMRGWHNHRVHNHRPYDPTCSERRVGDFLRGACLNDDGTDR